MSISSQIITAATGLYEEPTDDASLETELLFGELFDIEAFQGEWAYGAARIDGYTGYIRRAHLTSTLRTPTHRVLAAHAGAYRGPSFKWGRAMTLHMNSLVTALPGPDARVETSEGVMVHAERAGWIFEDQLRPVTEFALDYVAEALKFVGTPYLWGGRSDALDCSALVQAAFLAIGVIVPRDCFPQSEEIGRPLYPAQPLLLGRHRGDLVFWREGKGRHVAIMVDGGRCVHATIARPHRGTVVQPLSEVIEEQQRDGNGLPTLVRRL